MNMELEALEDAVYLLYKKSYPHGKAIKSRLSALQSELRILIEQYPESSALLLSSSIYRLHRRVSSDPLALKRHTPRCLIKLRPARTQTFQFQSQDDLTFSIQNTIATSPDAQTVNQLAIFMFHSINQTCLNIDFKDLREASEAVAIAVHKTTRVAIPC